MRCLTRAFLLAATLFASGLALTHTPAAHADPDSQATGQLAICKTVPLGTVNPPSFTFTVQGVTTPVVVQPGFCSSAVTVPVGSVTVTEQARGGFAVIGIEFTVGTGITNVAAGTATATIVAGQVTVVRFINGTTGLQGPPQGPPRLPSATAIIEQTRAQLCANFASIQPAFVRDRLLAQAGCAPPPACVTDNSCADLPSAQTPDVCTGVPQCQVITFGPYSLQHSHSHTFQANCPASAPWLWNFASTRTSDWVSVTTDATNNGVLVTGTNWNAKDSHSFTFYIACSPQAL